MAQEHAPSKSSKSKDVSLVRIISTQVDFCAW